MILLSSGTLGPKLVVLSCCVLSWYFVLTHHYQNVANITCKGEQFRSSIPRPPAILPKVAASADFPKQIWYKMGAKGQSAESKEWTATCREQNPTWKETILDDATSDKYVQNTFAKKKDLVSKYMALTVPILKADILRYLLLYSEGGLWNDLDVSCEKGRIEDWIPKGIKQKDINLVVGVEFDSGYGWDFERQFATWTVLAKPRSRHFEMVIDDILTSLSELSRLYNTTIEGIKMEMVQDVISLTGPARFARSVARSLTLMLEENITGLNFTNVLEPRVVGDVLILPGWSFAPTVNAYGEGVAKPPLVVHHYSGSWRNKFGGEQVELKAQS